MAAAMRLAVEAGRLAFRAGRIPAQVYASASSPTEGLIAAVAAGRRRPDVIDEPLEAELRRLEQERDEADRRYNDALTALDRAYPGGRRSAERRCRRTTSTRSARSTRRGTSCRRRRPAAGSADGSPASSGAPSRRTCSASSRSTRCWSITSTATAAAHARRTSGSARRSSARCARQLAALPRSRRGCCIYLQQITALRRHQGSRSRGRSAGAQRRGQRAGGEQPTSAGNRWRRASSARSAGGSHRGRARRAARR